MGASPPPGQKGRFDNPRDRPNRSHDKITEVSLCDFTEYRQEHGSDAVAHDCNAEPAIYLYFIRALVPREHKLSSELNVAAII